MSKEPIFFYLECQKSKSVGLFCLKTNYEDISVFSTKIMEKLQFSNFFSNVFL